MGATERYQYILQELSTHGQVNVDDLVATLNVSRVTIHRDLNRLVKVGKAHKVHGGAVLATTQRNNFCPTCHAEKIGRTPVILHLTNQQQEWACCPHCGLLAIIRKGLEVQSALMTDFLYGRMINARASSYVIGSNVLLCCGPSVLAFSHRRDAQDFRRGFGGKVCDFEEALRALESEMSLRRTSECKPSHIF